jgi:hypothetical protein
MADAALTIPNTYLLRGTADEFAAAVNALSERVEAEGERGVLSYRFFVSAGAGMARAVIAYADGAAWIGHHEIVMSWPEMKALHQVAELSEVTFLGPVSEEIRLWLSRSGLRAKVEAGYVAAAGFHRS